MRPLAPRINAARIAAVPGYASQFQAVIGAPGSAANITRALTAYMRSKNSENSPRGPLRDGR